MALGRLVFVVLAVMAVSLVWEVAPRMLQHRAKLTREVSERRAFAEHELARMVERYPTFMSRVAEETMDVIARGALWPAIERAWETNSVVLTTRAVMAWCASNIFVRLLSPQTTWEYVAIVLLLAVTLYVFANLTASAIVAGGARHKQALKYAARNAGAPTRMEVAAADE